MSAFNNFNMRRRSWQVWFVLATGTLVCLGALAAETFSKNFDGVGAIVPVVFGGMCACVGVYTFKKESGETDK